MVFERVLVVEDDAQLRAALKCGLEARGLIVHVAVSLGAATQLALAHRPDLCVVDLHLGYESGIDLIRGLRAQDRDVHLLAISGAGDIEDGVAAKDAGANRVLSKPMSVDEILDTGERPRRRRRLSLDEKMSQYVHGMLADCGGNKSEAARTLGIDRNTLKRWLDRVPPLE
jgi:two-component system response regulator RegA